MRTDETVTKIQNHAKSILDDLAELNADEEVAVLMALGVSGPEDADLFILQPLRNLRDGTF